MNNIFSQDLRKREQCQACRNAAEDGLHPMFFELIRVSMGSQDGLSRIPSEREWDGLYALAEKQSLIGICFVGVRRLCDSSVPAAADAEEDFARIGMGETLYYTWAGMAARIQQRNEVLNRQCVALQAKLAADGLRSCILKGQAVGALYGDTDGPAGDNDWNLSSLRQPGDIDIYVDCGREKAIAYARTLQDPVDWDYKHLHLRLYRDTEIEMHYVPEVLLNLRKNRRLQRWFDQPEVRESMFQRVRCQDSGTGGATAFVAPSVEFNLFYILLHAYRHFLYEGVGMRQLADYCQTLSHAPSKGGDLKRSATVEALGRFGMMRFARGVMWIMKEVFGLGDDCLLCEADEKEGRYILGEVMAGGNFGHYDDRLATKTRTNTKAAAFWKVLKHNVHLLSRYPGDIFGAPVWLAYHWCWKRLWGLSHGVGRR